MNTFFEIKENSRGNGYKNCHLVIKTEIDFMITNKPGLVQDVIKKGDRLSLNIQNRYSGPEDDLDIDQLNGQCNEKLKEAALQYAVKTKAKVPRPGNGKIKCIQRPQRASSRVVRQGASRGACEGENSANVSENSANVSENSANVTDNSVNVNENSANVSENSANVSENSANVSENSPNVNENSPNVNENSNNVSENSANVSENSANVSENSANVNENSANVCKNNANVSENSAKTNENHRQSDEVSAKAGKNNTNLVIDNITSSRDKSECHIKCKVCSI
ncbi:putative uncharacterized protein DDB_G0286901 [Penaeus japonicus]|uniref:putative uncharacterized protein DDB_G0286901 n=1 Tax=Penaeus japonicus TaxID=27405 RepID=UPI001C716C7D|nr:putative uncharacterized protein DDB_G0286901 [Penaeus japonicus]